MPTPNIADSSSTVKAAVDDFDAPVPDSNDQAVVLDFTGCMKKVDFALVHARAGLAVFPCKPLDKVPATKHGYHDATCNEEQIVAWWTENPEYNPAVYPGEDYLVLDFDKKDGVDGRLSVADHLNVFELFPQPTYTVTTASGGTHEYWRYGGVVLAGNDRLDKFDVKAHAGYVMAVGSEVARYHDKKKQQPMLDANGKQVIGTYTVTNPAAIGMLPIMYHALVGSAKPGADAEPAVIGCDPELVNSQTAIDYYLEFLKRRRGAVQGDNGSMWTFKTARFAKDYGLTDPALIERLLMEHWNDKCDPPWSPTATKSDDRLDLRIKSALKSAGAIGGKLVRAMDRWTPPEDEVPGSTETPPPDSQSPLQLPDSGGDTEFSRSFFRQYKDDFRVVGGTRWYVWTGHRWKLCLKGEHKLRMKNFASRMKTALGLMLSKTAEDDPAFEQVEAVAKAAAQLDKTYRRQLDVLASAANERGFAVRQEDWDTNDFLLGVENGVVDLKTGKHIPAAHEQLISKSTSCKFDATADCPRWKAFIEQVTMGDKKMAKYLQRWIGYMLTGSTREEKLLFIWGEGGNGKSKLKDILEAMLGDYSVTASFNMFKSKKFEGHPTEIAKTQGARLLTASEIGDNEAWDEPRIKQFTGGDKISAHFMRQDDFEFTPKFKLLVVANNQPRLTKVDPAMSRRMVIMPFEFDALAAGVHDDKLAETLKAELPGILNWAIEGCLDWQKHGLGEVPERVQRATQEYMDENDIFSKWIADRVERVNAPGLRTKAADLWKDWVSFSASKNYLNQNRSFPASMKRRGFEPKVLDKGTVYEGVRLKHRAGRNDMAGLEVNEDPDFIQ